MYIRTKTRKNKSGNTYAYAYLAKIKQYKKHPKQKIIKYLGRVYKPQKTNNNQLEVPLKSLNKTLLNVLKIELKNHDFKEYEANKLKKDDILVNLDEMTIKNQKTYKKVCIHINQGVLCDYTLTKFLKYKPPKQDMKTVSKNFAKTVVEAGIQPSQPIIIEIFKIIQTMINNPKQ